MGRQDAALEDIRAYRIQKWKEDWIAKNGQEVVPEPKDKDIDWPEPMLFIEWGSGYIVMTEKAFLKLPKRKQNKILKLGGI